MANSQSEKGSTLSARNTERPLTTDDFPCHTCGDERTRQRRASSFILFFASVVYVGWVHVAAFDDGTYLATSRVALSKRSTRASDEIHPHRERTVQVAAIKLYPFTAT